MADTMPSAIWTWPYCTEGEGYPPVPPHIPLPPRPRGAIKAQSLCRLILSGGHASAFLLHYHTLRTAL